jgi:hypothetical protein
MSASQAQQYERLLKQSLPRDGMRWKSRDHILRSPRRDRRVIIALRRRGVRLRAQNIQREFCQVMNTATNLARRGEARDAETSYEFVLAVR